MNLKIKTKDIELEYNDEYSYLEEYVKTRLIAVLDRVYACQKELNGDQPDKKPMPTVSAYDVFDAMKK